jgi:hypothetical protein
MNASVTDMSRSIVRGVDKDSVEAQKRINVEQLAVQQLLSCDRSLGHFTGFDPLSVVWAHFFSCLQQPCFCGTIGALGLPTAGQRKMPRQITNSALVPILRMTLQYNSSGCESETLPPQTILL